MPEPYPEAIAMSARPALADLTLATSADRSSGDDGGPSGGGPSGAGPSPRGHALLGLVRRLFGSRVVRYGFAVVAIGLGCWAVADEWHGVHAALARIGLVTAAGALVCVLAAMMCAMQSWRALLASLGSPLPLRAAARVMFVGQLGKYVPGSIWPVLAQMELGTTYKVPRRRSASASVLSMVVSVFGGLLAALVTLPFVADRGHTGPYLWAFLATPVLLACLHPKVLNYVLNQLFRLTRRPPLEHPLTGRAIITSISWSLLSFGLYGVQVWLFVIRLGGPVGTSLVLGIGTFAFAWTVGFLAVFAPAGAGVRDFLMIALLQPVVGTGAATGIALLSRALTTIGDLLAAGVALWFSRSARRPALSAGPAAAGAVGAVGAVEEPAELAATADQRAEPE
jgi:glycosyltransferase 2 family protein